MRTLTSIQSATNIIADLEFHLKASDQSTTWIFDKDDIINVSGLDWEVNFGGGLGKTSNYRITLGSSLSFIKDNFHNFVKGEAFIKVFVNSDNFTPHSGRVRDITRNVGGDPHSFSISVFDRFLDGDSKFPIKAVVDSYTASHPATYADDIGYPIYYGKHTRPFFMTAIDCNIASLLGPLNVSSENHLATIYHTSDVKKEFDIALPEVTQMDKTWAQQSGSTNLVSGGYEFEVKDSDGYNKFFTLDESSNPILYSNSLSTIAVNSPTLNWVYTDQGNFEYSTFIANVALYTSFVLQGNNENTNYTTRINYAIGVSSWTELDQQYMWFEARVSTGDGSTKTIVDCDGGTVTDNMLVGSCNAVTSSLGYFLDTQKTTGVYLGAKRTNAPNWTVGFVGSLSTAVSLKSSAYELYSIAGIPVNCSDIAFSENPITILEDVLEQSGLNVNVASASDNMADYKYQCYFDERQNLSEILEDFGAISGIYSWVGDSGSINLRTYQESGAATVDATIRASDINEGTFVIHDNPLGTTTFNVTKARRISIDYGYNFATAQYQNNTTAKPGNNKYCNSADASGIQTELSVKTKYIMETATSSLFIANMVRKSTLDESIVEMELPARFFSLEQADVLNIHHPTIVGSQSLFQITGIRPDYRKGTVFVKANELLNL